MQTTELKLKKTRVSSFHKSMIKLLDEIFERQLSVTISSGVPAGKGAAIKFYGELELLPNGDYMLCFENGSISFNYKNIVGFSGRTLYLKF